jgi:hypothetical protein
VLDISSLNGAQCCSALNGMQVHSLRLKLHVVHTGGKSGGELLAQLGGEMHLQWS